MKSTFISLACSNEHYLHRFKPESNKLIDTIRMSKHIYVVRKKGVHILISFRII